MDDLVKKGAAVCLCGNGYPLAYTAKLGDVMPKIRAVPEGAIATWMDPITIDPATGKQAFDPGPLNRCGLNEWVLIKAWDGS